MSSDTLIFKHPHPLITKGENIMSKTQDTKKGSKKEPLKTMKEKKAAKRDKKAGKSNTGIMDKKFN